MKRRDFIKQFGFAAAALTTAQVRRASAQAQASAPLSAIVDIDGRKLEYSERNGQDLGDFQGEGFVQRCIRADRPDTPLSVFFRPDRSGNRVEVVFELGRLWGAANRAGAHLGAYHATIKQGDKVLAEVDVPKHWWMARWRWQSAPRPVIHTPESMMAAKLLPRYSAEVARDSKSINFDKFIYEKPMDNAGIYVEMNSTGERPDIGPITEPQAAYINTKSDDALKATLAWGEGSGSMPIHFRDELTGGPIDFFQHPYANWYYEEQGKEWIKSWSAITDEKGKPTTEWRMDMAHDPAVNYLPFLLTGDPYFLEELQFQGTQALGWTAYQRGEAHALIVNPGQTRGFAWSLRTIMQLARVTSANTPRWLKNQAYWKHILEDNHRWFMQTYVTNPSPATAIFHAGTVLSPMSPWQDDFLAFILGWIVLMGFEEWRAAYLWKLQNTLARTDGKTGWPRQFCSPYTYAIGQSVPDSAIYTSQVNPRAWFAKWSEAWEAYKANPVHRDMFISKDPDVFTDDVSWQEGGGKDYLIYARGVLALATQLGVKDASGPYAFTNSMTEKLGFMTYRWAIAGAA